MKKTIDQENRVEMIKNIWKSWSYISNLGAKIETIRSTLIKSLITCIRQEQTDKLLTIT